ncbi:iron-sulfur cluster assembly protein [Trypanosoma conorhini]|uniref:Iron-sulfur cluster assembly protein n=1 Tax=Trypanosoma conorhini TaxID=83891 RepID=A0A422NPS4_9TRYP|nr:iron-sulfur cluster assembly protein [Trypanosoma conorhini]RNF07483.1 iron-sulfur cluster assembly protein [Trypanosoma conorhini]
MRLGARVCGVAASSSLPSRVTVPCCGALGHRCYATTHASPTTAAAENGHAPMPYKSTHKGGGKAALPARQRGGDKQAAAAAAGAHGEATSGEAPLRQKNIAGSFSSCAEDGGAVSSRPLSPLQRRQLLFKHKAAFTLTPQALRRVKYLLKQPHEGQEQRQQTPDGIRIGVRRRGCSGYSYTVNYHYPEAAPTPARPSDPQGSSTAGDGAQRGDVVVEQDGVKVVVDANALFYVIGTEMDYVVRNVEEKFTFRNPNQKYSCGCEESFMPFDIAEQETS